eukprot:354369-Chlamydomonas_euryale.AAC.1
MPLGRSGRVGQPGKLWTSTTRGPIAKVAPPALARWPTLHCPGWQLLLKLRDPRRPFSPPTHSATFCMDCTNAAPTRNGITPSHQSHSPGQDRASFKASEQRHAMEAMRRKLMDITDVVSNSDSSDDEDAAAMANASSRSAADGAAAAAVVATAASGSAVVSDGAPPASTSAPAVVAAARGVAVPKGEPAISLPSAINLLQPQHGSSPPSPKRRLPGMRRVRHKRPGRSSGARDVGKLPRLRTFATLPEIKVLMQQGVAEITRFQVWHNNG